MGSSIKTIGDIADIYDGPHATPKKTNAGPYFLSISSLNGGRLDLSRSAHLSEVDFIKWTKRVTPEDGDLLFSYETRLGEAASMPGGIKACLGRRMGLLRPYRDKVLPKFLLYSYLSPFFQNIIRSNTIVGATVNRIALNEMSKFKIWIPSINEQKAIALLLESIDKKIELNNQINDELEAMAKTLYNYWFVQFDFPDENGKPYKSSGGKMVYNETLKREIPEGWKDKELSEIVSRIGTGLNPRKHFKLGEGDNYYVTIKNIDNGRVCIDDKCDRIDDDALKRINIRSDLREGDILFTSIEPVGTTYLIQEQPKNWNINESVFTIRPNYNAVTSEFLYLLLSGKEMKAFTKNVSAGSIHKGVRIGVLNTFKLPFLNSDLVLKFTDIVKPMLKKQYEIEQENQKLVELRDWLLPMLMNGQVKIG